MPVAWLGLVAGSLHVVTGPDHLAALAPVVADRRRQGLRLGALWGLGHGFGVVLLGVIGQLFRQWIDAEAVSGGSEIAVGVLLVLMGVYALWRSRSLVVHSHGHEHGDGERHEHVHVHVGESAKRHDSEDHVFHMHGGPLAFGVGMLHGTAGVGHLLGVVPSLLLGPGEAAIYLTAYLAAAVVSMAAFGGSLGWAIRALGPTRVPAAVRASSALCVAVGVVWVWGAATGEGGHAHFHLVPGAHTHAGKSTAPPAGEDPAAPASEETPADEDEHTHSHDGRTHSH